MEFECKNKFLENLLNKMNIKEVVFPLKSGKVVTNLEVLDAFLKTANKKQLIDLQKVLVASKFNVNSLNKFLEFISETYAKNFILK